MPDESRQDRRFDIEAEKRGRRTFVLMIVGFAVLAMVGGVALALLILSPLDSTAPEPFPKPDTVARTGRHIDFVAAVEPEEPTPVEGKPHRSRPGPAPSKPELDPLQAGLRRCASKHGGLTGTDVTVDFHVADDGRVTDAFSRSPHRTPLGVCVAKVIRERVRVPKAQRGRDVTRGFVLP